MVGTAFCKFFASAVIILNICSSGEMFAKELDTLPEAEQWQFFKRVMDDLHDRAMQLKGSKQAGQSSSAAIDQSNDDSPFL